MPTSILSFSYFLLATTNTKSYLCVWPMCI